MVGSWAGGHNGGSRARWVTGLGEVGGGVTGWKGYGLGAHGLGMGAGRGWWGDGNGSVFRIL